MYFLFLLVSVLDLVYLNVLIFGCKLCIAFNCFNVY